MLRRRMIVHGHVQGVFFRAECRREAVGRGLAGWVRNRRDSAVEAVFEGSEEELTEMEAWMRHGPPSARVDRVEVSEEPPEGLDGFEIRH